MKPKISDTEFAEILDTPINVSSVSFAVGYDLTDDQTMKLCQYAVDQSIVNSLGNAGIVLSPHHIDYLLANASPVSTPFIFRHYTLTPSQVQIGLDSDYILIRVAAANNKGCSESQKVAYHLKWGVRWNFLMQN